nr:pentatricopeptide repeat protein AaPPR913 [Agave angustifolia]
MMSNMYAEDCNWSGVTRVRKEMKGGGLRKIPGCSSIEVNGEVHEFVAGGNRHPEDAEICNTLAKIEAKMQKYDFQFTGTNLDITLALNMKALKMKATGLKAQLC